MDRKTSIPSTACAELPDHRATGAAMAFLPILMTFAAFLIDLDTPDGLLDGFLYVAAVVAAP